MGDDRIPLPIAAGTIAGIAAWAAGYAVTVLVATDAVREELAASALEPLADAATGWQIAGWLWFNAHGVDVRIPEHAFPFAVADGNFLVATGEFGALYIVPAVTLGLAGAIVTWRYRERVPTRTDAAMIGATTCVGYLCCVVVGLIAFAVTLEGTVVRPAPITGVLLAGLAYPIVFGSFGGLVVSAVTSLDATSPE